MNKGKITLIDKLGLKKKYVIEKIGLNDKTTNKNELIIYDESNNAERFSVNVTSAKTKVPKEKKVNRFRKTADELSTTNILNNPPSSSIKSQIVNFLPVMTLDVYKNIDTQESFPCVVKVQDVGWWTTNETGDHVPSTDDFVKSNCRMLTGGLRILKMEVQRLLVCAGLLHPNVDAQNLISHMVVRSANNRGYKNYSELQNKDIEITHSMLSAKRDFLILEVNKQTDLHTTLVYSKGIGDKIDLIKVFEFVLKLQRAYPQLQKEIEALPLCNKNIPHYWYETRNQYPFNTTPPENYIPAPPIDPTINPTAVRVG